MLQVTVWDYDIKRIIALDALLYESAQELGIKLATNSVSEPPALARERLMGRVPVLEIGGNFWSLKDNAVPDKKALKALLKRFAT